jgi:predicted alpha/beta superfamily hydrolase
MIWQDYTKLVSAEPHTVTGNLKIRRDVVSPQLGNQRDLLVYLPPSYTQSKRRYPVIYMHDGQNLFDQQSSYAGEWQVDETMQALSQEGVEAIIVGIPNSGAERLDEYSPFHDPKAGGGKGDRYLTFLTETVKPLIDRSFRTLPNRAQTGIIGSSMGGLISLYGFLRFTDYFGFVGAMSPALWFAGGAIFNYVHKVGRVPGRVYLDVGTHEVIGSRSERLMMQAFARRYSSNVHRMYSLLIAKGYRPEQDICYVEEPGAEHNEAAWARRLPQALQFLLGKEQN